MLGMEHVKKLFLFFVIFLLTFYVESIILLLKVK